MHTALNANPVDYGTWDDFKAAFEKQFVPPAAQMEAIAKMHNTSMGAKDFATWFLEWSTQARRTGADETSKMWAFRRALPPALQNKLLTLSPQLSRTYYFIEVDERRRGLRVEGDCSIGRGGTGVGRREQRQGAR